ncbi:MAG: L,D-transpeptidase family protein [Tetrasphaera sp.]
MNKRAKVLVSSAVAVPLVLASGATAYAAHYRHRALPGSSIAGLDVAGMSRDEVATALRERAAGVAVDVSSSAGSGKASLAELGYAVDVDASVERVFDANGDWSAYARSLFGDSPVDVVVTRDPAAFDAYVAKLAASEVRPATSATVARAKDKKSFAVTPSVTGHAADATALQEVAARAANSLTSASASVAIVDQAPEVTTAEAKEVADAANALVRRPVQISAGKEKFTASTGEKASWVSIPDQDGEPVEPVVSRSRVASWVAKAVKSVDTEPQDGSRHLSSKGKVVRVVTQAVDGVKVTNADDVAASIVTALDAGSDAKTRFATKTLKATWTERTLAPGAENLAYPAVAGEKWIDLNLSRHTMTAYVGGSTAFGPVLMVNGAPATPTDVGTFSIYWKNPLMTMRGQNADGTDYETPDVPWSSFFNGGEALHGAYWRSSFGYAASHGCVNLPIPTAKWVYDWAPVGTPVVSHY